MLFKTPQIISGLSRRNKAAGVQEKLIFTTGLTEIVLYYFLELWNGRNLKYQQQNVVKILLQNFQDDEPLTLTEFVNSLVLV